MRYLQKEVEESSLKCNFDTMEEGEYCNIDSSDDEAKFKPQAMTREQMRQLHAGKALRQMEKNRAKAEKSIRSRFNTFMNTIDPVPEPKQPRPPVPVRLRPVPKTELELLVAAKNSRLFGPDQHRVLKRARGKLIGSVYQSWKAGRPIGHVFLFLLGDSGVGKSSTVNHLIHENVAATSDCQSETRSTTEHILITADPNLAASNVSLSIVDPPGFNDADGLEQDARNLRSIEKFFRHHPSLMGKTYPNIILVTVASTDVRFQGKNSRFMKCLRAIQRLHLVDRVNPNIVVVITWACALPLKQLKIKMEKIRSIVLDAIHIDAPVVCLENLPEEFGLEKVGDYTQLPDGTLQPRNLFEAMIYVAKNAGDEFAQHCLSTYFDSDMEKVIIETGLSEPARTSGLNSKERKLLERLKNDLTQVVGMSEVAQKIDAFIKTNPLTEEEKNELTCVKYDLTDNLKMTKATDLRGYSTGQLCHMLRRPISANVEANLKAIFTLRQDSVVPNIVHDLGKGYNLINDTLLPSCIFKKNLEENSLLQTQFGFMLPQGITLQPLYQSGSYMENFANVNDYVKHRLKMLGVNIKADTSLFNMSTRGGLNRINSESDEEASFLYEQRLFRLEFSGWYNDKKPWISKAFVNDVLALPEIFDKDHNKREFEDFFHTWGHFFVVAGYGGGSVDVSVATSGPMLDKRANYFQERVFLERIFKDLAQGSRGSGWWRNDRMDILSSNQLKWSGGDCRYHTSSLTDIDPERWRRWVDSLARNPALLTMDMVLVPIQQAVGEVSHSKLLACGDALRFVLGEEGRSKDLEMLRMELQQRSVPAVDSPLCRTWSYRWSDEQLKSMRDNIQGELNTRKLTAWAYRPKKTEMCVLQ